MVPAAGGSVVQVSRLGELKSRRVHVTRNGLRPRNVPSRGPSKSFSDTTSRPSRPAWVFKRGLKRRIQSIPFCRTYHHTEGSSPLERGLCYPCGVKSPVFLHCARLLFLRVAAAHRPQRLRVRPTTISIPTLFPQESVSPRTLPSAETPRPIQGGEFVSEPAPMQPFLKPIP